MMEIGVVAAALFVALADFAARLAPGAFFAAADAAVFFARAAFFGAAAGATDSASADTGCALLVSLDELFFDFFATVVLFSPNYRHERPAQVVSLGLAASVPTATFSVCGTLSYAGQ